MAIPAKPYMGDTVKLQDFAEKDLKLFGPGRQLQQIFSIELYEGNGKYRVFTDYGRLGSRGTKQVRETDSLFAAEAEFDRLVRSKLRKGYVEVDLAQSTTGSDKAKELIDVTQVKVVKKPSRRKKSDLHPLIQAFVAQIFDEAGHKLNILVNAVSPGLLLWEIEYPTD